MAPGGDSETSLRGLASLRRRGAITELLFLYECATEEPSQLRPIAERLGLTVQAASHTFQLLQRRGLAEVRSGRYLPTVRGVSWLHSALGDLAEDLRERSRQLPIVRSCRAIARRSLPAGAPVSLELDEGLLYARPGSGGASRGVSASGAKAGELVTVVGLEGIVPLSRGAVRIVPLSDDDLADPGLVHRLRRPISDRRDAILGAHGLEAFHALRRATGQTIFRFAVAEQAAEASRLGVGSTIVVLDAELPRFLAQLAGPDPPPIEVVPLLPRARRRERRRAARAGGRESPSKAGE